MKRPNLVRHIALVDYSERNEGDPATSLCGRVAPGFKHPRPSLFFCHTCFRALEDEYEDVVDEHDRLASTIRAARSLLTGAEQ